MPWSAKAQQLLRQQYASVGAAAKASLVETVSLLEHTALRQDDVLGLLDRCKHRLDAVNLYVESYRRYCWKVDSVSDLKVAPFHLLASEGHIYSERNHVWHIEKLTEISRRVQRRSCDTLQTGGCDGCCECGRGDRRRGESTPAAEKEWY